MKQKHVVILVLAAFYLLLFLPFLGQVHLFDWDEINFAEAAREMLVTKDWLNVQINFEPFWEKPPLFIWLQAASMSLFGVNEFAARFPNVMVGLVTILLLYKYSYAHYGQQASIATVLLYIGSMTPHFYFKSGIIDPLFNLLMFLSIYQLVRHIRWKGADHFFLSGLFLGLAVLAKGPVALLIVGLTGLVYQLLYRHNFYKVKDLIKLLFGLLLFPAIWLGMQVAQNGWWFIAEFTSYQLELFTDPVASHGQPFYYHAVVLIIGCFPVLGIASTSLRLYLKRDKHNTYLSWMKITFWVVLILFSLVTTKIVHYSSMCYIPLAVLGGEWVSRNHKLKNLQKLLIAIGGLFWAVGLAFVVHLGNSASFKASFLSYVPDPFTKLQLMEEVSWSPLHYLLPLISLGLTVFLLWKYSKANLISYLIFHSLFITILITQLTTRIEGYTQNAWITHLKSYQGKEMQHFTLGFKSYAHYFYTASQPNERFEQLKREELAKLGYTDFYGMSREDRQFFDVVYLSNLRTQTKLPFSITVKEELKSEMAKSTDLKMVFEGNGYSVWERKD